MKSNKSLIMIIDDSPTNIDILAGTLKDEFRLTIAKSGQTAFERLDQQLPDLILLDIMMPDMDGFEICRRLKSSPRTCDIPIIFITAMEEAVKKTKGFKLGAVDYITRPFHVAEVLARVRTHLSLRQMHMELGEKNRVIRRALDEKSRQLDDLISNLPGIVYRCRFDDKWHMDFFSDGCSKLTGFQAAHYTGEEGRPCDLMADAKDKPSLEKKLDRALESQSSYELVYRIKTSTDEERWVFEQGVGVYDEIGAIRGLEGFISDITEKQKLALALGRENKHLKSKIIRLDRFDDIVGKSPAMRGVYELIIKAAAGDDCVIVYGPSGTGKELVAKAIHKNSKRKDFQFIPINCGAIPEGLFESEFFGHKRGAFSGANTDKKGILDIVDGGTLFLDELGEISLSMQVKLLRVMDGNGFIPVGGTELKRPDIRFVCATNQDLQKMVRQKKLREDFFFRIHIIPITLPALRSRREDIPLLIEHFLNSYPQSDKTSPLTPEVINEMVNYSWPGNIRQLQNVLYQFLTLGKLEFLDIGSINNNPRTEESLKEQDLKMAVEEFEKKYISKMLDRYGQKKGEVADVLKMDRKTLFRKIKRYGL